MSKLIHHSFVFFQLSKLDADGMAFLRHGTVEIKGIPVFPLFAVAPL